MTSVKLPHLPKDQRREDLIPIQVIEDLPCILFAEDLVKMYPEAKVILTKRDAEKSFTPYPGNPGGGSPALIPDLQRAGTKYYHPFWESSATTTSGAKKAARKRLISTCGIIRGQEVSPWRRCCWSIVFKRVGTLFANSCVILRYLFGCFSSINCWVGINRCLVQRFRIFMIRRVLLRGMRISRGSGWG